MTRPRYVVQRRVEGGPWVDCPACEFHDPAEAFRRRAVLAATFALIREPGSADRRIHHRVYDRESN